MTSEASAKPFAGKRILIIEHDDVELRAIALALRSQNLSTCSCRSAINAVLELHRGAFDLVVLSADLPQTNSLDLLPLFRTLGSAPVLIIGGTSDTAQHAAALKMGAYAYIARSSVPDVLIPQVTSALATLNLKYASSPDGTDRAGGFREERLTAQRHRVIFDGFVFDLVTKRLLSPLGKIVKLTNKLSVLLLVLAENENMTTTTQRLVNRLNDGDKGYREDRIVNLVRKLRDAIAAHAPDAEPIITVRGEGYRLSTDSSPEMAGAAARTR
jgi:DNA-binding response OmpR family regulator